MNYRVAYDVIQDIHKLYCLQKAVTHSGSPHT